MGGRSARRGYLPANISAPVLLRSRRRAPGSCQLTSICMFRWQLGDGSIIAGPCRKLQEGKPYAAGWPLLPSCTCTGALFEDHLREGTDNLSCWER